MTIKLYQNIIINKKWDLIIYKNKQILKKIVYLFIQIFCKLNNLYLKSVLDIYGHWIIITHL